MIHFLSQFMDRIQLIFADSASYLQQLDQEEKTVDVVYLDPMFPQRDQNQQAIKKQAQVKKQMQLLHLLLPEDGEMDLGDHLLELAKKSCKASDCKTSTTCYFFSKSRASPSVAGGCLSF